MRCFFVFILMCFFVSGCAPYIDTRREAGLVHPIGQSTQEVIAICYNSALTDDIELQQIANTACLSTNEPAKRIETRYFNCTLFTPNTALYKCMEPVKP